MQHVKTFYKDNVEVEVEKIIQIIVISQTWF